MTQTEQEITLFHGTDAATAEVPDDIYGNIDKKNLDVSGNLTDNRKTAERFALRRADNIVKFARVLEIKLRESEVENLGPILFHQGNGYALKEKILARTVPVEYLSAAHMSKEVAKVLEEIGSKSFYKVPREKVVAIHKVNENHPFVRKP